MNAHMFLPRRVRAFTLIELLVTVSIISVLLALLLPSLKGARDQAKLTTCAANLRGIGVAMYTYTSDNEGLLPFGALAFSNTASDNNAWAGYAGQTPAQLAGLVVSWDDLLAKQMGRELGDTVIIHAYTATKYANKQLICPADTENQQNALYPIGAPRSYSANAAYQYGTGPYAGVGYETVWGVFDYLYLGGVRTDQNNYSVRTFKLNEIDNPSRTFTIVEAWGGTAMSNVQGGSTMATTNSANKQFYGHGLYPNPSNIPYDMNYLHNGYANYLYGDGHVEKYLPKETVGGSTWWPIRPHGDWLRVAH